MTWALPKPSKTEKYVKGVRTLRDGREICTPKKLSERKFEVWLMQDKVCSSCKFYLPTPAAGEIHHKDGRGMGGGKRDDRIRALTLLCKKCHGKIHNQLWA